MDPQGCFSTPLASHLANQPSVISNFARSFPDYPRLIPTAYEMHLRETGAFHSVEDDDEKDNAQTAFPTFANNNSLRYQTATIRKAGSSSVTPPEFQQDDSPASGSDLPADLSAVTSQPSTNTRLLREILQGKKQQDDSEVTEDLENDVGSPTSVFLDEDSGEDLRSKTDLEDLDDRDDVETGLASSGEKQTHLDSVIISGMRVPSNGAASENSEQSSCSRKTKRKQIHPQQLDGVMRPGPGEDNMRKQLSLMQEQIDVLQERYSSIFDEGEMPQKTGHKRKHGADDFDPVTENGPVAPLVKGASRMNDQLAALISTEIHEKISPIVASVINKYLQTGPTVGKDNNNSQLGPQQPAQPANKPRSKTASPVEEIPTAPKKATEKAKQPLNVNNDAQMAAGKNFGNMYMNFPARPFFGNENKLGNDFLNMSQLVAGAMAAGGGAPTMYNPNFQHLLRPNFFPAEQTEAMPLVVSQKKKRHKVTDTRVTPRVMSRMMSQGKEDSQDGRKFLQASPGPGINTMLGFNGSGHPFLSRSIESLQGLNHSDFSPFYPGSALDNGRFALATPPFFSRMSHVDRRETSSPLGGSVGSPADNDDASMDASDNDSVDMSTSGRPSANYSRADSLTYPLSSTLTPMHLRKAKLMFFFTRYPNSATLKTFFPDIKFNKNNTAQLVKWFSNFREFFYIQMEKFAKQALADGIQNPEEIEVSKDSELYRALNLHYNRNNHIDVPDAFRDVVEGTLKEFFKALQSHRDQEPSWKKAIYKVINRMDDVIPDYFRLPHFLEQLE